MRIEITKRTDGGAVLKCVRDDASVTWQKQEGHQGAFFPLHDLTHYSVESELGIRNAFYGLIADGWDIEDTTGKGARGPLSPDAVFVEHVVGTFDTERASSTRWTAEEFNDSLARSASNSGGKFAARRLTEDDLARIRKRRAELFQQWHALPAGQTLSLVFPAP